MQQKLITYSTEKLLQKYGAGNHTPGSGSAAANLGLISAQLLRTVIILTTDSKRSNTYSQFVPEFKRILDEIDGRIIPNLQNLFQEDSDLFDRAIEMRQKRNDEKDIYKKTALSTKAIDALRPATEIPIQIAQYCLEIANFSNYAFTHGFKSARGDAGVAQTTAIAAIGGCISIVNLNLLSFGSSDWIVQTTSKLSDIQVEYLRLVSAANDNIKKLEQEANEHHRFQSDVNRLLSQLPDEALLTDTIIEKTATQLQLLLWEYRNSIWKSQQITDPLQVLKPDITLRKIGYQFYNPKTLGTHNIDGDLFEVAGIIDKDKIIVQVSKSFEQYTQNFTAAHELGHAIFHKQAVLHRDKAIDGSTASHVRDIRETQANKFAANFLMPKKQVLIAFKEIFLIDKFEPTAQKIFNLTQDSIKVFRANFRNKRDVSRYLAEPLAGIFEVSVETMAIRLEELNLVEY